VFHIEVIWLVSVFVALEWLQELPSFSSQHQLDLAGGCNAGLCR
jgi:hypothetical protein